MTIVLLNYELKKFFIKNFLKKFLIFLILFLIFNYKPDKACTQLKSNINAVEFVNNINILIYSKNIKANCERL